jgi:PAS domain S-box-containing protein
MIGEDHFRDTVRRSLAGYFCIDKEGRFQDVNDAWLRMHGYDSPDEVIGQHFSLTQVDADMEQSERNVQRLLAGEIISEVESSRRCKDGSVGYHSFSACPIREHGEIVGLEGFLIDTTTHWRLETILQRAKREWETTFDALADWVSLIDLDGRILRTNRAGERLFGMPIQEIVGQNCFNLTHASDEPVPESPLPRMIRTLTRESAELFVQRLGLWLQITVDPVKDSQGNLVAAVHIVRDITERKQVQQALEQRNTQLEALRQVGLDIIARLDLGALLLSIVSRAAETLGGNTAGVYLHRPEQDMIEWAVASGPHAEPMGTMLQRGEGLAGKVWESGEPIVVNDYRHWEGRAAIFDAYPFSAIVGVPVRYRSEFLGVLVVHKDAPQTFSQADAEMLDMLAAQAAVAIRNARLYDKARQEIAERKRAEAEREQLIRELQDALQQVKVLSGILPICASCKRIRDEAGDWHQVEVYVRDHSEAEFSHSICPECARRLYPDLVD